MNNAKNMLVAMVAAALASFAHAGTTEAQRYVVEDPFFSSSYTVNGDTLIVDRPMGVPVSSLENTPALGGSAFLPDFALLFFTPKAGYTIAGYDAVFDVSFAGGVYDDFVSSGQFRIDGGSVASFTAKGPTSALLNHHVDGSPFDVGFEMSVEGLGDFCLPGYDPLECSMGVGIGNVVARLQVNSIQVTPVLVAVPEPATWVAMVAGLAALGGAVRRRRAG